MTAPGFAAAIIVVFDQRLDRCRLGRQRYDIHVAITLNPPVCAFFNGLQYHLLD